jgi:hypothetical protein
MTTDNDKPIVLTLKFTTHEQAQHVLEAYGEAMGFGGNVAIVRTEQTTPAYEPPVEDDDEPQVELDERGVPYHPDFHSSSKKISKGAWNRKKGHDRAAADAYEAGYLQANSPHAGNGVLHANAQIAAAHVTTRPSVNAPGSLPVSLADFHNLWTTLCNNGKVFMTDQEHIQRNWGGHPMSPTFNDPALRQQAYDYLMTCSYRQ